MSFDWNKGLASLQGTVTDISSSLTPFARRTRQMLNEKLGSAGEVTALPEEYLILEHKVEAVRAVHHQLLGVLQVYDTEGYDYPPNLKETFLQTAHSIQTRVTEAASAHSVGEVGSALVGHHPSETTGGPKTLHHALGRSLERSAAVLEGTGLTSLQTALQKLAEGEVALGGSRIEQDHQIQGINTSLNNTLQTSLSFANQARKNVHNSRLTLDASKTALQNVKPGAPEQSKAESDVEKAEDAFVAAIEEAVTVMRNVLETPELMRCLSTLAQAQLDFHKKAAESLSTLTPELEKLREEQETKYRESRA